MRGRAILCGMLLFLAGACRTSDENTWTYRLSREAYDGSNYPPPAKGTGESMEGAGAQSAILVPLVLLGPFIIDTIFLPVALTHDVLVDD